MNPHRLLSPRVIGLAAAIFMASAPATAAAASPSVSITGKPANPSSSTAARFVFSTSGATSVACRLDGSAYYRCASPVSFSGLAAKAHTFAVKASNRYAYRTASYSWTIQTTASSAASIAAKTPNSTTAPLPVGVGGSWKMKFDDEFNSSSLDLTKWQPNWLGGSNTAVTPPDNGQDLNCMSPSQVTESGGVLHLTAVARSCAASNGKTYQYASGLVNSYKTFNFTYGYMEARVYIPAASTGTGANFPAFWADGTGAWPTTGELDVMEVLGTCGLGWHFHSTLGAFGGCTPLAPSTGWHTVGANWQAGSVTYYYDGHKVGQIASGVTGAPMYVILNNSVDPTWGGPIVAPADMQVDYVRVWQ